MSDTILDLQQPDDESPIYNLKIYNKVTPLLLISLGSLYVSIVIFRYLSWRCRRRKQKKIRMDRQKLERYWRKRAVYLVAQPKAMIQRPAQSHTAPSSYHSDEKRLPHSSDSTATLVVSGGGSFSNSSSQNQFIIPFVQNPPEEEAVQDDEEEIVGTLPYHLRHHNTIIQKQQQSSNYNKKRCKSKRDEFMGKVTNRIDGNYQRKKRSQLLWQWSVAMGYCRYNHGHHLDTMITRLLESKSRSSKNNNTTNNSGNESC